VNHKPSVFKVVVFNAGWDYAERHPLAPSKWVAKCACGWRCAPQDEKIQAESAYFYHMMSLPE
jgi:hypothetical protein